MTKNKGFTLIELMVSIAIIAVLSSIVMFSVSQYINKGKDSNISGNLAVLIPAGEVYYNFNDANYGTGYTGFCASGPVTNALSQISLPAENLNCSTGLCCNVSLSGDAWAACAQQFTDNTKAFCVDSRGVKKEIDNNACISDTPPIVECP